MSLDSVGVLAQLFVYLFVALLAVPAAKWAGMGGVIGYLVAGVVIGPWGLALVREPADIAGFTRVTVLLLLFVIALRATPARVARLRDGSALIGLAFVGGVAALVFLIALALGQPWHASLVSALALALVSDAMATEAFRRRYPTGSPLADTGQQLLLTQQLLLVPLVVVVLPVLGFERTAIDGNAWPRVATGAIAIALVVLVGDRVLRQGFRFVVGVGVDELFAAFVLLAIIGVLLLFAGFGLPLEIGALAAGFLLVRSEYGSAIDIAIRPFRGLIVGLFFIAFGMQVDFATFFRKPVEMLSLVALLILIKIWVLRNLLRFSAVPRPQRIWLATLLAQGGELAFVMIALAVDYGAIRDSLATELVLIATLSMLSTPVLLRIASARQRVPVDRQLEALEVDRPARDLQVIVAGYGRVGRVVARLLADAGHRVAVIDNDPDRFAEFRQDGFFGFYGNALRPELIEAAGARRGVTLVVALDNAEHAAELVRLVRRAHPHLSIVARAVDRTARERLLALGADRAHAETFESALLMGEDALETLGTGLLESQALTEAFRDRDQVSGADAPDDPSRLHTTDTTRKRSA